MHNEKQIPDNNVQYEKKKKICLFGKIACVLFKYYFNFINSFEKWFHFEIYKVNRVFKLVKIFISTIYCYHLFVVTFVSAGMYKKRWDFIQNFVHVFITISQIYTIIQIVRLLINSINRILNMHIFCSSITSMSS